MSKLSERIAADVLKASGSGLQNYTMNGSRERIIAAASVADDLLEALQEAYNLMLVICRLGDPHEESVLEKAHRAIAKALGEQS